MEKRAAFDQSKVKFIEALEEANSILLADSASASTSAVRREAAAVSADSNELGWYTEALRSSAVAPGGRSRSCWVRRMTEPDIPSELSGSSPRASSSPARTLSFVM